MSQSKWLILALPLLLGCPGGCYYYEPIEPAPAPLSQPPAMERIAWKQVLPGPQHFALGMTVSGRQAERNERFVLLEAGGKSKEVAVAGEADFYAPPHRPDVIIMHDRYCPWMDTIRVFRFSPAGVRETTYGHGPHSKDYYLRAYRGFEYAAGRVIVTEDLSAASRSGQAPSSRRFEVPLD